MNPLDAVRKLSRDYCTRSLDADTANRAGFNGHDLAASGSNRWRLFASIITIKNRERKELFVLDYYVHAVKLAACQPQLKSLGTW